MEIKDLLDNWREKVEKALDRFLAAGVGPSPSLAQAMRYSVFSGGKRIRPLLVLASTFAVGGDVERAIPYACALEMIHTYSLIHDDLPAMDNEDYRRGRPTSHRLFGEAMAILAGDALLTEAFQVMANPAFSGDISPFTALRVIHEVSKAVGIKGMVGGQALDVEVDGKTLEAEQIRQIHLYKTAAFITVAVKIGGLIGGADERQLEKLVFFGNRFGMAFQLIDDIMDFGEQKASNLANVLGVEEARSEARKLLKEALMALSEFGTRADPLREIAYSMERLLDHGKNP